MTKIPAPTERLLLRLADAPFLLGLLNTRGWLDNIGDRGVYTLADAQNYYYNDRLRRACETPGCGPMLCVLKNDGTTIDNSGVYDRPGLDLPDFGFAFLPEYHGRGYAYEASVANLTFAHGHKELLAITLPTNKPSIRLLEKLGFKREEELIRIPGDDEAELILFRWKSASE